MQPTPCLRLTPAVAALALATAACTDGHHAAVHHSTQVASTLALDFPAGPIATDAATLRVRGRASSGGPIASVTVNGVGATSSDGFAHWQIDVPLVDGNQALLVDVVDSEGQHVNANANVERVPRVLPHDLDTFSDLALDAGSQRVFFTETDSTNSLVGAQLSTIAPPFVSNALDGSGATVSLPTATVFDAAHSRVLVWDQTTFGDPHLTAVDPATNTATLLSGSSQGSGPLPSVTETLAVDSAGAKAYLFDPFGETFYVVDLATGDRTILSDATHGSGPMPGFEGNLALDEAGDRLVVADDANLRILSVDLATGDRSVLSDNVSIGAGPPFVDPKDVAVAAGRGSVLVADATGKVLEVSLTTGDRSTFSGTGVGAGPALAAPFRIDVSESLGIAMVLDQFDAGRLIAVALASGDRSEFTFEPKVGSGIDMEDANDVALDAAHDRVLLIDNDDGALDAVARASGARTVFSGDGVGSGPTLDSPKSFVVDAARDRALVVDDDGAVVAVALANGNRAILSDSSHGSGPAIEDPEGSVLDSTRGRLLVAADGNDAIVAVNLTNGNRSILSDETTGSGPEILDPIDIDLVLPDGPALVLDEELGVVTVDLATGNRTILSDTTHGAGPAFVEPRALVLDSTHHVAIVGDGHEPSRLVAVDLATGDRTILVDDSGAHGFGPTLVQVNGLFFDPLRDVILVSDNQRDGGYVVDAASGDRAIFSND
jgi:hypothetical protein